MIHYHGLPITPATAACAAVGGGHAFVSFRYADQLGLALEICQSFAVDNGAFSAWKSGKPITDWTGYYAWVDEICRSPSFDFAVIPDVIDGDEEIHRQRAEDRVEHHQRARDQEGERQREDEVDLGRGIAQLAGEAVDRKSVV